MSAFLSYSDVHPTSALSMAACRTAAVAVLSAVDVVAGVAVNSGVDPEIREGWARYLPSAPALVVFAVLTVALAVKAEWARAATVLLSGLFALLTLFGLLFDVVVVAVGASPALGGGWYVPFRCAVAIFSILLYLTAIAVLTASHGSAFPGHTPADEYRRWSR